MTNSHPIDVENLFADQLATASPDLLVAVVDVHRGVVERGG
jgi:hypothetical protein